MGKEEDMVGGVGIRSRRRHGANRVKWMSIYVALSTSQQHWNLLDGVGKEADMFQSHPQTYF